ncbi:MAG: D-alanyl-D-alanine carboxypeptidase/D-alanyl-D-alanine-endopeptidase [Phycisphaerales bacterium]|nr:D-alanyl-D-alanine carboxypeptidase/D-alanyl-D-alanine-endopeptidase [Phycisphaerales bacterium]
MPHHILKSTTIALLSILLSQTAIASLQSDAQQAIRQQGLEMADVGVAVLDPATGRMLVDINASTPRIPASNMKLLTSGTAAMLLGSDFRYRTRLVSVDDDLVVIGSGDPAFGDTELLAKMTDADGNAMDVEGFLNLWVDAIVATGRSHFDELIIDDRVFDRDYVHHTWPKEQLVRRYCAGVSGLNFHRNIIRFYPRPGGRTANVERRSPTTNALDIRNEITSTKNKRSSDLVDVHRKIGTNQITLKGNVTVPMQVPIEVTVHDMPGLFGAMLAERLEHHGVTVSTIRLATASDPPFSGDPVGPVIATPLSSVLKRCNQDSYNLYAEALLKTLGATYSRSPGTFQNGATVIRHTLQDTLQEPDTSLRIADGSGMSRSNRISPETLAHWLASFDPDDPDAAMFIHSLATPGNGTLSKRFTNRKLSGATVLAKSGYLNGVCSLSGLVIAPDGRRLVFSIIVNHGSPSASHAKRMQERIVERLARSLTTLARG